MTHTDMLKYLDVITLICYFSLIFQDFSIDINKNFGSTVSIPMPKISDSRV